MVMDIHSLKHCESGGGSLQDAFPGEIYGPLNPLKWMYHTSRVEQVLAQNDQAIAPVTVHLVPTLRCDHRCYFCTYGGAKGSGTNVRLPVGVGDASQLRIEQKDMPFDLMQRVLEQLASVGVAGVIFTGGGEPTCYSQLAEAMTCCRELGMAFALNTNGRGLDAGLARRILSLNPRYIRVSLNAGSPEIQRLVTGVDDFDLIVENIRVLARLKNILNAATDISIGYVVNVVNLHDIMGIVYKMSEVENSLRVEGIENGIYSIQFRPVGNYESSKHYSRKRISQIMTYLDGIGGEALAQEFWRFMYEGEQCSAAVLDQALAILDGEAAQYLAGQNSHIRLVAPRQKFLDLPRTGSKLYDRCRVLPWFLFVWPDGTAYSCVEWAGTPGFEIGNLGQQAIREILFGGVRQAKIDEINRDVLHTRCAPICAHHEMNISLDRVAHRPEEQDGAGIAEIVRKITGQQDTPPHLEFL